MAFEGLDTAVSSGRVTARTESMEAYGAGNTDRNLPGAVAFPAGVDDVSRAVSWAAGGNVSIVPFSSGAPHSPPLTDSEWVALDLSGIDRVVRADRRNRVAIVEPGVTFGELEKALAPVGLRAMTTLAPRSNKSVLAAYIDREPTLVPRAQWDLSDPLLCIEAVMGTGKIFRTGCSAGPGTLEQQWAKGQAQKNPMGPSSFDYFRIVQGSRGSLGIVTWASVKCELRPRARDTMIYSSDDLAPLVGLVYGASRARYGEETLILDSEAAKIVLGLEEPGGWTLLISAAGFDYRPDDRVAYQAKGIREMARKLGLSPVRSSGVSADAALESASSPREGDWRDSNGAHRSVYFLTTLDRTGDFASVVKSFLSDHSLERSQAGVYIQPQLGGRVAHFEATLFLSKTEAADGDALSLDLARRMKEQGAYFSRPAGSWAHLAYEDKPGLLDTLRRTKKIFDPKGVLSIGALSIEEVA